MLSGNPEYTAKARPLNDEGASFWQKLYMDAEGRRRDWLEHDLYEYTKDIVNRFISEGDHDNSTVLEGLRQYVISGKLAEQLKEFERVSIAYMMLA